MASTNLGSRLERAESVDSVSSYGSSLSRFDRMSDQDLQRLLVRISPPDHNVDMEENGIDSVGQERQRGISDTTQPNRQTTTAVQGVDVDYASLRANSEQRCDSSKYVRNTELANQDVHPRPTHHGVVRVPEISSDIKRNPAIPVVEGRVFQRSGQTCVEIDGSEMVDMIG